jgi:hypothetical protein
MAITTRESARRGDRASLVGSYLQQIEAPGYAAVQLGRGIIAHEITVPVPAWFDETGDLLACILPPNTILERLVLDFLPGALDQIARRTRAGRFVGRLIDTSPGAAAAVLQQHLPQMLDQAIRQPKGPIRPPSSDMPPHGLRIVCPIGDPRHGMTATMIAEDCRALRRMLRTWLCVELLRQSKDKMKVADAFSQVGAIVGLNDDDVRKLYYRTRKEMGFK